MKTKENRNIAWEDLSPMSMSLTNYLSKKIKIFRDFQITKALIVGWIKKFSTIPENLKIKVFEKQNSLPFQKNLIWEKLDIIFCQITTFIKVRVAFVFGLQIL